jgi:WD40 repeat protein
MQTETNQQQESSSPIEFDYTTSPHRILSTNDTEFGLHSKHKHPIYTKNVKWAPDGLVLLSNSDDNTMRLFELDASVFNPMTVFNNNHENNSWKSCLTVRESGPIYDFDWYPKMTSSDPSTSFFISTSCAQPVHMWDAFNGSLLHSYECINDKEELVTPISVSFNSKGDKIYCGLNKSIKVFDTELPGSRSSDIICCEKIQTKYYGQTSLISCFAFPKEYLSSSVFAAGCYNCTVGLYDERQEQMIELLEGHSQGVTYAKFTLCGNYLISAVRKSGEIFCWDLRNIYEPVQLFQMNRDVSTNVKVSFDIDVSGRYLITGNDGGRVSMYDLSTASLINTFDTGKQNCINSAVFHPYLPYIATSSGERRFDDDEEDNSVRELATISLWALSQKNTT